MSIYNSGTTILIGRGSGNDISVAAPLPQQPPYGDAIHTYSFVYKADDGTGISSLQTFWDGLPIGYIERAHSPINWTNANNLYMGRFYNYPINAMTYNAGFKVFKQALTEVEMLAQHTDQPTVIEQLPVNHPQDILTQFTFENVTVDGYIVRIHSVFPFNTEQRLWRLGYRNQVKNLTDNSIHIDTTGIIPGVAEFDPYDLPFDLPFTRALYPAFFPSNIHEHRFYLNLVQIGTNTIAASTGGFVSPNIPALYNPYEYGDLMYRNDAQNVSSYTVVNTNEVSFITDLSGGDVHNFNQILGKDFISGANPATYTNMTLETAINGHLCFDGFLSQGVHDTWNAQPGNVLKKNMNESYTWIHVARLNDPLGTWDALLTYGRNLDSLTLSYNSGQQRLFPSYAGKQLYDASLFNANPILLNKNILIVYSVFEKSSARLQIWDIDNPSIPILNGTATIPVDPNLLVVNAVAMPFYIGCNNLLTGGTTQNHTGHTHGETILYNSYLTDTETNDVKDFLVNKWGAAQ
jgi:hypothetical protein